MANGASDPIPTITSSVWDWINGGTWTGGGWNNSGTTKYLYLVRDGTEGGTQWALYSSRSAPSSCFQAQMSSAHWNLISGGTLNTGNNTISQGGDTYRVAFSKVGSAANAYVSEV